MSPGRVRRRRPTVDVDNGRCEFYGICQMEAPDVFRLGADGRLRFRSRFPEELMEQVKSAARCCPMQAIEIRGWQR
jgi:ferredoxin